MPDTNPIEDHLRIGIDVLKRFESRIIRICLTVLGLLLLFTLSYVGLSSILVAAEVPNPEVISAILALVVVQLTYLIVAATRHKDLTAREIELTDERTGLSAVETRLQVRIDKVLDSLSTDVLPSQSPAERRSTSRFTDRLLLLLMAPLIIPTIAWALRSAGILVIMGSTALFGGGIITALISLIVHLASWAGAIGCYVFLWRSASEKGSERQLDQE